MSDNKKIKSFKDNTILSKDSKDGKEDNSMDVSNMNSLDIFERTINTSKVHLSVQQRTGRTHITKIEGIYQHYD